MLKNLAPTIHELIPSLLGSPPPLEDGRVAASSEHPGAQVLRPLHAQSSTLSTYVIPATFPEDPRSWFPDAATTYPLRDGNEMEYLIDGQNTFEAMVEAIETARGPEHFIVLLGWAAHFDFKLAKICARYKGSARTAGDVFSDRAKAGVKIRLLLWKNTLPPIDNDVLGNPY